MALRDATVTDVGALKPHPTPYILATPACPNAQTKIHLCQLETTSCGCAMETVNDLT